MKATLIFHDLRRSAVRNLVAASVDQSVAMRVTGLQTISAFQRYRIVSDDDVRAALERTQARSRVWPRAQRRQGRGTMRGTTGWSW